LEARSLANFRRSRYAARIVSESGALAGVAAALRDDVESVIDAWLDRYEASVLRMPGRADRAALRNQVAPTARALADALRGGGAEIRPGAPGLREVEKELSFLGATLEGRGAAFDCVALVFALRDALLMRAVDDAERAQATALFDWLVAVAGEGVAHAGRQAVVERVRELLEERSPVELVAPDVPAAFLLGDAEVNGVRGALARLVMSIARVGARAVIVDAAGLTGANSEGVVASLYEYCTHRKIAGKVTLVVCGLEQRAERAWRDVARGASVELHLAESFPHAQQIAAKC